MKAIRISLYALTACLIACSAYAARANPGVPSLDAVYQMARKGNWPEANAMMRQVLAAYPNSAKAHYVDAEVLAGQGRADAASAELNNARRLDPTLSFASPHSVHELQQQLAGAHVLAHAPNPVSGRSPWPWFWLAGIAFTLVAVALLRKRFAVAPPQIMPPRTMFPVNNQASPGSFGLGMPVAQPATGAGNGGGILSSLATGAAMGAGFAAGEELVDHFLHHDNSNTINPVAPDQGINSDLGGQDFGIANGAWVDDSGSLSDGGSDDFGVSDSGGSSDWS